MAAVALRRWTCPKCSSGKLAPGRPRRDDVRRYCLACSEATGRLVERVCPAQDGARERRAARRLAAEAKARAAAYVRETTYPNSLYGWFEKWSKLKAWGGGWNAADLRRGVWQLTLRRRSDPFTTGRCIYRQKRIVVSAGTSAEARGLAVVLHELAHAAAEGDGHGALWRRRFMEAIEEVTGRTFEGCKLTRHAVTEKAEETLASWLGGTPPCLASMGCLCAGHARGDAATAPCNTSEEG